ncbi:MAG: bifunctional [glutamine synthetase] adenylyltransferase/[glutamine synthetase]-adenylyl-L-tyrosine phosphorylase [Acidobacteria bacterium]|nr:bifunctional [glutamine synthetase] adenylyltransferase/[glutamine synthetase]-adenylyl-L-tyrosine phosphorylase [Acidobacteriota bacterium]
MADRRFSTTIEDLVQRSADPTAVRLALDALDDRWRELIEAEEMVARGLIALAAASRSITRFLLADPSAALQVLGALDRRPELDPDSSEDDGAIAALVHWRGLEFLRITARDLLGIDPLEVVGDRLAALGRDVLGRAVTLAARRHADPPTLAVIGMGKLGGEELNYSSDIDVMFVGEGDPRDLERMARHVLEIAGRCFRVDANLRPEGRNGPLVRSIPSYEAYWDRWALPWEFQALLKARPAAGDPALATQWWESAQRTLWSRPFDADALRSIRQMKERAEAEVARKDLSARQLKLGPGGIRDIEFTVQLLQLVHGHLDPEVRSANTLTTLGILDSAGYIDGGDATAMVDAYRLLRTVEHRLQLVDEQQVHTLPTDDGEIDRLARVMGLTDAAAGTAGEQLQRQLTHNRAIVRSIHERVYFRPLLEAFASSTAEPTTPDEAGLTTEAISARLTAFGFTDALRTRAAVRDLTRGLSRSSRLMQQMLPLLLTWLSASPDPDLGLLIVRNLLSGPTRMRQLVEVFRDSPAAAQGLCRVAGTSRLLGEILMRNPDLIARLPHAEQLITRQRDDLLARAAAVLDLRHAPEDQQAALQRWKQRNLLGIAARDLFGIADVRTVGVDLTALAEACVHGALLVAEPRIPVAVFALGRFGGSEMAYASDLDVMFVHRGDRADDIDEARRVAESVMRFIRGSTPAIRIYEIDADLRPEGRNGVLSRTVAGHRSYWADHALTWERQAMSRARFVAGDPELGAEMQQALDEFVWGSGLTEDERREIRRMKARIETERIPVGEDPDFHLKLGRGSLSDIEFTAQMLQLEHSVRSASTLGGLTELASIGALESTDAAILAEAFEFCERVRNRWYLVNSAPGDALPSQPEQMLWLARALDTSSTELRSEYRRVTRRARAVVDRVFYGRPGRS